ncbi:beta-N-acetylhexosaminidase [Paenibacillus sp. N1-5-1-14]|uniref:beta-N-acetylhexosaminidase n=1 Tax=Paenibacillus radicibacter TaxID=2972488 RepID=UPI00215997DF|nr:beta-N-acetylhexosaminidase [Paenibacillus radicibacter]MCR8645527.1 beta-N-acetylhexosaminidase [Paenibacillus radicibacter]
MDVSKMTLLEKVGQMVQCGFEGTVPSEEIKQLIREQQIGGVIYFSRNVKTIEQVAKLSDELQEVAAEAGVAPLWIAIDQEGGMVARLTDGVALMPGNMALAAGGLNEAVYQAASITGEELRALGINLNYAPDIDVNNNARNPVIGVRSYGESPELVANYGRQAILGLQDAGIVATAKHFPGHGDTEKDSHLDLPTITHARERIYEVELRPFMEAIDAGVDAIMSSHIHFPAFEDQKLPVTLSHNVLTGLLREELGYQGVIMTDCMEMEAIATHYGTVEASVMAVEAGADMILISHRHDRQLGAIEAIVHAVEKGQIAESRIDESVERLMALKRKRGLFAEKESMVEGLSKVGCDAHLEIARIFSEASVTLVKDEAKLLPINQEKKTIVISMEAVVSSLVDESYETVMTLGKAIGAEGFQVEEIIVPIREVTDARIEDIVQVASGAEQIVIGTYNAHLFPQQQLIVKQLQQLGKPLIVVALRNPYDLQLFDNVSTYVAIFENRPMALQSVAKFLSGRIEAKGKLPVTISELYPAGWGVETTHV